MNVDLLDSESPDHVFQRIFGSKLPAHGVVHVAAVTRHKGKFRVLRIQNDTPKSDVDFYVLNAVRAWADVVLTSGKILREEPNLSFTINGPTEAARRSLGSWRGQRDPLQVAILSSGRGLALALQQPALQQSILQQQRQEGSAHPVVFTSETGARRLAEDERTLLGSIEEDVGTEAHVKVVADPTPRSLALWAKARSAQERVAVELGPSTSAALYQDPILVDRLLLSEVEGPVPSGVLGGEFLPGFAFERYFEPDGPEVVHDAWSFRSFRRR